MDMTRTLCAAAIASVGALLPANAAIIGAVSGVITSGGPGFGTLTETLDQSGLSATYTSGVTDFGTFVAGTTHTPIFAGFEWFSEFGSTTASVTYNLGAKLLIDKMALWNEESSGIGLLDLLVSDDGITFTSLLAGLLPTDNPVAAYSADVFAFGATAFQFIRMDMSKCPQPLPGSFPSCAIGEVAFNQVAAVPVPAGGLLLLAALGGLGLLRRRNKAA